MCWYIVGEEYTWNAPHGNLSPEQRKRYRYVEEGSARLYACGDLTAPSQSTRTFEWRGANPPNGWRYSRERLEEMYAAGRIALKKDGTPRLDGRKMYLDEHPGAKVQNILTDIQRIGNTARKRLGYPTQKPLALLERIISASSNPGDMILDPFCDCATALVAADRLQRQWAGIDLSPLAVKLVDDRIRAHRGRWGGATVPGGPPPRTDLGDLPTYRTHRHRLYGEQEGVCAGCNTSFPFPVMEVDHILPRSRGGTDHAYNLQLLCSGCNRSKGRRTMAEGRASS